MIININKINFLFLIIPAFLVAACGTQEPQNNAASTVSSNLLDHSPTPTTQVPTFTPPPTANLEPTLIPTIPPTYTPTATMAPLNEEISIIPIPLIGESSSINAEFSGLAWYNEWLILLPQYPDFDSGESRLFAIHKDEIEGYLEGRLSGPIQPRTIPFITNGIENNIRGFEGFEAIVFNEDNAYLTVEARSISGMSGYIVRAQIDNDLNGIKINPSKITEIESATNLSNKSEEALLIYQDQIFSIHEANGIEVNSNPVVHVFNEDLENLDDQPFPHIEYRITDVTEVDEEGRFWAINYFFPGEPELFIAEDPITTMYGLGKSHSGRWGVERLIELQINDREIIILKKPPIQLELQAEELRNWEGIVRFGDSGFLIVTDKFPETILGFVSNEN